jgi:hypothetical protein
MGPIGPAGAPGMVGPKVGINWFHPW